MDKRIIIPNVPLIVDGGTQLDPAVMQRRGEEKDIMVLYHPHGKIGTATATAKGDKLVLRLEIREEFKHTDFLQAFAETSVNATHMEGELAVGWTINAVHLVHDSAYQVEDVIKDLQHWYDLHEALTEVNKMIRAKENIGWSKRRIKRWLFKEHKIVITD